MQQLLTTGKSRRRKYTKVNTRPCIQLLNTLLKLVLWDVFVISILLLPAGVTCSTDDMIVVLLISLSVLKYKISYILIITTSFSTYKTIYV